MPSAAHIKFINSLDSAFSISEIASSRQIRPISSVYVQSLYHASLAACVACWQSYVQDIIQEYYSQIASPLNVIYSNVHSLSFQLTKKLIDKYNTPNFENSREIIVVCTGYDPYNHWSWPRKGMNILAVQQRLNQILKVRHSFAHGHSMPAYNWNQTNLGLIRLDKNALTETKGILVNLVNKTDRNLHNYILSNYSVNSGWY